MTTPSITTVRLTDTQAYAVGKALSAQAIILAAEVNRLDGIWNSASHTSTERESAFERSGLVRAELAAVINAKYALTNEATIGCCGEQVYASQMHRHIAKDHS